MEPSNYAADALRHELARRDLLTPALALLMSHRPLAFAAGQLLHLLDPLAILAGRRGLAEWATLLSDPEQLAQLEGGWCDPSPARGEHADDSRS